LAQIEEAISNNLWEGDEVVMVRVTFTLTGPELEQVIIATASLDRKDTGLSILDVDANGVSHDWGCRIVLGDEFKLHEHDNFSWRTFDGRVIATIVFI
jgi:hypothetical protein